jgi:hypothetical protein
VQRAGRNRTRGANECSLGTLLQVYYKDVISKGRDQVRGNMKSSPPGDRPGGEGNGNGLDDGQGRKCLLNESLGARHGHTVVWGSRQKK